MHLHYNLLGFLSLDFPYILKGTQFPIIIALSSVFSPFYEILPCTLPSLIFSLLLLLFEAAV